MAKGLDDCEVWLPSQFLTDDDLLMDFKINSGIERDDGGGGIKYLGGDFQHGSNPFGPHSDLSSPVETESDEEEYITELTRKMAHSALLDSGFCYKNTKGWSLSDLPQSTLCGCKQGSSTPKNFKQSLGSLNSNQHSLCYQELQVAQFQRLKQQQFMKQRQGQAMLSSGNQNHQKMGQSRGQHGVARPMNSSISCWPTLSQSQQQQQQQEGGSGMRAVFLGNDGGPKKECAGTGVFLPRIMGEQTESRKKPVCSTVLLPERVVQALNLDLEAMDGQPHPDQVQARCNNAGRRGLNSTSGSTYRVNMTAATQQRRNVRTENTYSQPMSQDLLLPQEWTY